MFLGKVVGTVWATRKDEELVGLKFQIVKHIGVDYAVKDTFVVAVDTVQAGAGDVVLVNDYQLGLTAARLRDLRPDLRIVNFTHTPFCGPDDLRVLPAYATDDLCRILIGNPTYALLDGQFATEFVRTIELKGHEEKTTIYRILGRNV